MLFKFLNYSSYSGGAGFSQINGYSSMQSLSNHCPSFAITAHFCPERLGLTVVQYGSLEDMNWTGEPSHQPKLVVFTVLFIPIHTPGTCKSMNNKSMGHTAGLTRLMFSNLNRGFSLYYQNNDLKYCIECDAIKPLA